MPTIQAPRLASAVPVPPACVMDFCAAWVSPFVWPDEAPAAVEVRSIREINDDRCGYWLERV